MAALRFPLHPMNITQPDLATYVRAQRLGVFVTITAISITITAPAVR